MYRLQLQETLGLSILLRALRVKRVKCFMLTAYRSGTVLLYLKKLHPKVSTGV